MGAKRVGASATRQPRESATSGISARAWCCGVFFLTEVLTGTSGPGQSKQEDFSSSPLPELTAIPGDRELQHRKPLDRDVSLGRFLWSFTTCLQTPKQCLGAKGITGPGCLSGWSGTVFFVETKWCWAGGIHLLAPGACRAALCAAPPQWPFVGKVGQRGKQKLRAKSLRK